MTHRALIVDDERLARLALRKLLAGRPEVEVVGEAHDVASATEHIQALAPSVVFLDVQMPGGSGFSLFDRADVDAQIVFVTAYDDYAVRAFEVNALDYLVKPVHPDHITRVLARLESRAPPRAGAPLHSDDVVCLTEAQAMKFVRVRDITHIAAADEYTEVHLASGRVALVPIALRSWVERLPADQFAQTHRSMLVNLHRVDEVSLEAGRWSIRLLDSEARLPLSRRFAQSLRKRFA